MAEEEIQSQQTSNTSLSQNSFNPLQKQDVYDIAREKIEIKLQNQNLPTPTPTPTPTPIQIYEKRNYQHPQDNTVANTQKYKDENKFDKYEKTSVKPLRTYKDDIANAMKNRRGSFVSIITAENDRNIKNREKTEDERQNYSSKEYIKKVSIVILSAMLVVFGAGAAFYFYGKSKSDTVEIQPKIKSIIFADETEEFEIADLSKRQILSGLSSVKDQTALPESKIKNISIVKSTKDKNSAIDKKLVSSSDFLNSIEARVSTAFIRSLETVFMLGIHILRSGNQPFLILKTNFYENSFAGMLQWENNIKEDLASLFNISDINTEKIFQKDETNTVIFSIMTFNDAVIKNKDARILKNENDKTLLIYSFLDKNTIVITNNENTFNEVFTRFNSSRILQ